MDKKTGLGKGLSALFTEKNINPDLISMEDTGKDLKYIETNLIRINPLQPRTDFDDESLSELAESIKQKGLLQPVSVKACNGNNEYILISGERRLRASKLAGLNKIPAVVYDKPSDTDLDLLELALIENIQRKDLNAMELSDSFQKLAAEFGLTQEQIAEKVFKQRSTVANFLRLQKLPQQIKDSLRKNEISEAHARMLLRVDNLEDQIILWKRILDENISVRSLEDITKSKTKRKKKRIISSDHDHDPYLKELENKLRNFFGTKVTIKSRTTETGEIIVEYFSNDDLERILDACLSAQGDNRNNS